MLLTCLFFSFSGYILLSPFKVSHEISNDFEGEKTETAKDSAKELIDIDIEQSLTGSIIVLSKKKFCIERRNQLPCFVKPPNTPPPNLG